MTEPATILFSSDSATAEPVVSYQGPPPEVLQLQQDYADLQVIASSLESAKVALSLKSLTPPEQVERHQLYDRLIAGYGTPLLNTDSPAWKIGEKPANVAD